MTHTGSAPKRHLDWAVCIQIDAAKLLGIKLFRDWKVGYEMLTRRSLLQLVGKSAAASGLAALTGCARIGLRLGSSSGSFDLVVYGGTPSGIMAAQAAARRGRAVAIVEQTNHVGGILSNGVGVADTINVNLIQGLPLRFFKSAGGFVFAPHVAEDAFVGILIEDNVTVYFNRTLASVTKVATQIQSITLDNGDTLSASQWIDASYEGDLMAMAGVSYTVGRESTDQYGESYAGWGVKQNFFTISPYASSGQLLPYLMPLPSTPKGGSDNEVMAYTFRICTTNNPSNMLPFPQPPNYSPSNFAGLSEFIAAENITDVSQLLTMQATVQSKFSLLYVGKVSPFSTNFTGGSWSYPNADNATRMSIWNAHYEYVAGFLYFLANDPSVPASVRSGLNQYGLAADEFTDHGNWPWQMYVREGRRMVGQKVMTQEDVMTPAVVSDSIAIGQWYIDCQPCGLFGGDHHGSPAIIMEGPLTAITPTCQIPFRSILPNSDEITNLAVVFCLSASHIAFSSLRVEPVFMALGEAAGTAAYLALKNNVAISAVNISELQSLLLVNGNILSA